MNRIKFCLLLAVLGIVLTGYADELPPVIFDPDAARGQGGEILRAIQLGDYRHFVRAAKEIERDGDAESFAASYERLTSQYGKMTGFRFLTFLRTPLVINQIWRMDFVKFDSRGREIKRQLLLQLLFGKKDGKYRLVGMRVI